MLNRILSPRTCADCRQCCIFDSYDIFCTPVLLPQDKERIAERFPDVQFLSAGKDCFRFRMHLTENRESLVCPVLNPETGCLLGKEKPFDCRIFPFRLMSLHQHILIGISPLCEAVMQYSMQFLLDFLKQEFAETLFSYAEQFPELVHEYDAYFPVLLWKPEKF